jgi:nucleotide-binding universal stress UspA family protein
MVEEMKDEELHSILVPVDGSEPSRRALHKAVYIAGHCGASLTLLNVVDLNKEINSFEQVSTGGYVPSELKVKGYELLTEMVRDVPRDMPLRTVVKIGDPAKTTVEFCEEEKFDLIIIGSRGYSRLKQMILGSASQYVILRCTCPVMIVR